MTGFWKRAAIPISGLVILCLNIATVFLLRSYFDLDKDISKIPGLSNKPEQRFILVLAGDNPIFKMQEYYDDFDCSPLKKNLVAFSDENARVIHKYLAEKKMSALRASGYYYLIRKSEQEFDIQKEAAYYLEAFKITNSTGFIIFLQNRLHVTNVEPYFHKMLVETSDEKLYSIKGKSALKVSRIYSKYGELDKAEYWYKKASETANISDEDERKKFADGKPPKVPPFNIGKITGIVNTNGTPAENINIGLFPSANLKNFSEFQKVTSSFAKYISFINLRGGTITDRDGRFSFNGLGEGEYVLLLSIKTQDNKTVKVLNSPGTITISKAKPSADAGVIRLAY